MELKQITTPNRFQCFVVWQQGKVAPNNKTNKKRNKRVLECFWPIGALPGEPQETSMWGPRASQEDP